MFYVVTATVDQWAHGPTWVPSRASLDLTPRSQTDCTTTKLEDAASDGPQAANCKGQIEGIIGFCRNMTHSIRTTRRLRRVFDGGSPCVLGCGRHLDPNDGRCGGGWDQGSRRSVVGRTRHRLRSSKTMTAGSRGRGRAAWKLIDEFKVGPRAALAAHVLVGGRMIAAMGEPRPVRSATTATAVQHSTVLSCQWRGPTILEYRAFLCFA